MEILHEPSQDEDRAASGVLAWIVRLTLLFGLGVLVLIVYAYAPRLEADVRDRGWRAPTWMALLFSANFALRAYPLAFAAVLAVLVWFIFRRR